jgi:xanthine dehydrogenase accessory factor
LKRAMVEEIVDARASRRPAVLFTWLDGSRQEFFGEGSKALRAGTIGESPIDALVEALTEASASDRAHVVEIDGASIFVQPLHPPLRLLIVGAVHIGQHLAVMANSAGYEVTVVDPRRAFASPERFPRVELRHEWPATALAEIGLDARTAIVTLTHDPKLDDPALLAAIASSAFYVGALGSRRTHAGRLDRLREQGATDAALSRIHAPVGLDIGARSPAEIAISVLAQMTERLRERA